MAKKQDNFDEALDAAVGTSKVKVLSDRPGTVIFTDGNEVRELKHRQVVEVSKSLADELLAMHQGELRII